MKAEILSGLKDAILNYESAEAVKYATLAVEQNIDPIEAMEAMVEAIKVIGDGFQTGDLFLPELVGAADVMQKATPIIEQSIRKQGMKRQTLGVVLIGTVFGDIHTIGKSMVTTLLSAEGFTVHDLGINVPSDDFLKAIDQYKPDILAMSALLTTTAPETTKVIAALEKTGKREQVKVMVGGGAISEDFANFVGADGYAPTAPGAVNVAKKLIS
ncbi:MAG: cobalamin-binding protein [Firmicutes bacterium]|nr:cobalamin-binding protein [Bacillota bacterium]